MKYRGRFLAEYEVEVEAPTAEQAVLRIALKDAQLRSVRVLGVVPAEQPWPNTEAVEQPRPPRNTPPSGTPGTPTARLDDQLATAVAA